MITAEPSPAPAFGTYAPRQPLAGLIAATRACPRTWLGKRAAFTLRRAGLAAVGHAAVDIEALGLRLRLHPRDNTSERRLLFTPDYFDPEERAWLLPQVTPGFVFVDVGANAGAYGLLVAAAAKGSGRTIAIEANPGMYARLAENARLNPGLKVEPVHCAVSDHVGDITLYRHKRNLGETSIRASADATKTDVLRVPAKPLALLVSEHGLQRIDGMKLDIEGAEDIALGAFYRAAPENLWPRCILMEMSRHRWAFDVGAMLIGKGYRQVRVMGGNEAFVLGS